MAYEDLIAKMTLEEKCAILSGGEAFRTREYKKYGIPKMQFSDGPHGLRLQGEGANHLGIGGSLPATCFPTATTVANTWDPELAERMGHALGEECLAEKVDVLLGPGLCIKRSPLCGRDFEYYSEDPYLAGKMAAASVRGIQSTGVSACPKHFAVNQQETRRQASDSVLDDRTLREIYLAGFETVVKESDPMCIMSSYNKVNGTFANDNKWLLTDVLRDEWGFNGAVVTDWGGSNDHAAGVRAGSTFEMPTPGLASVRELIAAVKAGEVSEADVDARVEEALGLILPTTAATQAAGTEFDKDAHHELAREVAAQGIVLMKNEAGADGTSPLLPLAAGTKVALIGDFAQEPRYQGAGSSLVNCTKLDKLTDLIGETDLAYVGFEPGFERLGGENESKAMAALDLAKAADVVLMCLGLDESTESEGAERVQMALAKNQTDLLARVAEVNPNVVVILQGGSPVECGWVGDAKSILYLALGGQAGASAALDVLTGSVNPSGKLNESWPWKLADTPCADIFPSDDPSAEYREGIFVGYRYYQTAGVDVAFPFGHGLSYTTFTYGDATATPTADGGCEVKLTVTNTGDVAGAEVVEAYVALPDAEVFRPAQELKGFQKVYLHPGESADVTIALDQRAFSYYNVKTQAWEVEGGTYEVRVGSTSEDIRTTATLELAGTGAPNPYEGVAALDCYRTADVKSVSDESFSALLGHDIPDEPVKLDRNLCFRDLKHGRSPIFWLVGAILEALKKSGEKKGAPNLNVLFIYNMPLRAIPKNGGGILSMGLVDALVMEIKGFWLIGLIRAIFELIKSAILNSQLAKKLASANNE